MKEYPIVDDEMISASAPLRDGSSSANRVTVKLKHPFEVEGRVFTSFSFRPAEAGDAMDAEAIEGEFSKTVAILAAMSGTPLETFRRLPLYELNRIVVEVAPLLGEPSEQPIGSTS